ncbi:hypothetical protein [Streptomyces olindensis]|uniref:hypothetical protein n=1 Tax=Streptomyces olindensis TaxID=358823 RepID=UPI0034002B3B
MKGLTVFIFVLSALLILMACIKADRVRSWRESANPSAPEIPDSAFTAARVLLVVMAVAGVVVGFQGIAAEDNVGWSDDELTSAVEGATTALDGSSQYGEIHASDADFDADAYATTIEGEIVEHGGGDAPQSGVDAAPEATGNANEVNYTIRASDAELSFCMQVTRTRSKEGDYEPPGVAGGPGTVTVPSYKFAVTTHKGEC